MSDKIAQASLLFEKFHGRKPERNEIATLSVGQVALQVGHCIQIAYRATGDGKDYRHDFSSPLPLLYVGYDGSQAYLVNGIYRFTDRGFVK